MVLTEQLWDDVHRLSPQKHVAFLGVFVASHSVLAARVRLFRIHTIATHIVVLRQQRTYISNLFIHSFIHHSSFIHSLSSSSSSSHIGDTATEAGAAANQAAANKIAKYHELASTHIFYPVAIETGGTWNHWAVELVQAVAYPEGEG